MALAPRFISRSVAQNGFPAKSTCGAVSYGPQIRFHCICIKTKHFMRGAYVYLPRTITDVRVLWELDTKPGRRKGLVCEHDIL